MVDSSYDGVIVIGISGVSCGGKTTLADKLLEQYHEKENIPCFLCRLDDYYKEEKDISVDPETGLVQRDVLEAILLNKLHCDVEAQLKKLKDLNPRESKHKALLIIEGILLYQDRFLNDLFNKRYFLTLSHDVARERRSVRVYKTPDAPGLFEKHVWPMYVQYRDDVRKKDYDVTEIDGSLPVDQIFSIALEDLEQSYFS